MINWVFISSFLQKIGTFCLFSLENMVTFFIYKGTKIKDNMVIK